MKIGFVILLVMGTLAGCQENEAPTGLSQTDVEGVWVGTLSVRFMGHTLVAQSRLALVPGQQVIARVESLGPPLVLSLTGQTQAEDVAMNRVHCRTVEQGNERPPDQPPSVGVDFRI